MLHKPALRGRRLIKSFGDGDQLTTVLHEVSLDLYRGQTVLLMGPSGSGKSTLLAVLSGLLHPCGGQVTVMGQDLWRMTDRERERFRLEHCGFIFQGYNLFPALTARQQLEMVVRWGEGAPRRDARRRADEMLGLLGLSKRAHLRPGQLSGGEKQRVAIGRALIKCPTFCFADEPTSSLDWVHGEQVIELLRTATQERGTTNLIVSHDHRLVPYADRVVHLDDGRLTEVDSLDGRAPHETGDEGYGMWTASGAMPPVY